MMLRVVLDTNVAVSGLLWTGPAHDLLRRAQRGECRILATEPMIAELRLVLGRGKFRERLRDLQALHELPLTFYRNLVQFCPVPRAATPHCTDRNDQMFIDLAVAEHAHVLVSGDAHLLRMKNAAGTSIVTVIEALGILDELGTPRL